VLGLTCNHFCCLIRFFNQRIVFDNNNNKNNNNNSQIINQVQQYEAGVEISPALSTRQTAAQRCSTTAKTPEQQIAPTAAAKLDDGDVKGVVRILCSEDKLA